MAQRTASPTLPCRLRSISQSDNAGTSQLKYKFLFRSLAHLEGGVLDCFTELSNDGHFSPIKKWYFDIFFYRPYFAVSNGLLCLADAKRNWCALWNPSTNKFKILPNSSVPGRSSDNYLDNALVFMGLGFDPTSEDFKVVRATTNYSDDEYYLEDLVELYSLKNNTWRQIPCSIINTCNIFNMDMETGTFSLNSCSYWLAQKYDDNKIVVVSFNFTTEKFTTFLLPPNLQTQKGFLAKFVEVYGKLSIVSCPMMGQHKAFDFWVMEGESWTKKFRIESSGVNQVVGYGDKFSLFFESSDGELLFLDGYSNTFKHLGIHSNDIGDLKMDVICYVESPGQGEDLDGWLDLNTLQDREECVIRFDDCRQVEDDASEVEDDAPEAELV